MIDSFEKNIFINCPFDNEYTPLLKCLLFTAIYCEFNPRIALERFDSGEVRLEKILQLIQESKYGIHDLSRARASKKNEYYRLNMPFEIGLDLGCRIFHADKKYRAKSMLILEKERYSYQKALSDISNSDILCHNNDAEELVYQLRIWLYGINNHVKSGSRIWDDYNDFTAYLYELLIDLGFKEKDFDKMPIPEYLKYVEKWCAENK